MSDYLKGFNLEYKNGVVVDKSGNEYRIWKNVITTIGMSSNHKSIQDRVVMRRWVWWCEKENNAHSRLNQRKKENKKGFVLKTVSVRNTENRNLSEDFIAKNNLSERDVRRFQVMFDNVRKRFEILEEKDLIGVIDLKERVHAFLSKYYEFEIEETDQKLEGPYDDLGIELYKKIKIYNEEKCYNLDSSQSMIRMLDKSELENLLTSINQLKSKLDEVLEPNLP